MRKTSFPTPFRPIMIQVKKAAILWIVSLFGLVPNGQALAEPTVVKLRSPSPYQVTQREGFRPSRAYENHPGGPELGQGKVWIDGEFPEEAIAFEFRESAAGDSFDRDAAWRKLEGRREQSRFQAEAQIPAGGWRRFEVRAMDARQQVVATASVEPIGAGEVFLIAGQSYASNSNDERLQIEDPLGRVVAFHADNGLWAVANDPQPTHDHSDGGSIWPAFGNLLLPVAQVPIAFVNVSVGGTSSRQWLPGGDLHKRMTEVGRRVGKFRAVLWQQGESDVIEKTSTAQYVENLQAIRAAAVKGWGFDPPWLLAKSTLHPTVYRDPEGESRIRTAIDQLCRMPGFRPGPDTDILGGPHRGDRTTRRHFTGYGQRAAASLWFVVVWNELNEPRD